MLTIAIPIWIILVGIATTTYGLFMVMTLAIQCWWLLCQICFHKNLPRIEYDIPIWHRVKIILSIVIGITMIALGIKFLGVVWA